ncbi:hypothetical protein Hanom_Chr15g01412881 [Helianthus anomalus]
MTVPKIQSDPTVQSPGNGRPLQLGFEVTEMNFFFCVCVIVAVIFGCFIQLKTPAPFIQDK